MSDAKDLHALEQLLKRLRDGERPPVIAVIGEEHYYADRVIKTAEQVVVDPAVRDLNQDILYGSEISESQLLSACLSLPMMSEYRLVVCNDFDQIRMDDPERLIQYLEQPETQTVLILQLNSLDKRRKWAAVMQKRALILEASPIQSSGYIANWIQARLKHANKQIDNDAVMLMVEHVGNNLFEIDNQIEKLLTYKIDGDQITVEDVELMTGISKTYSVFELTRLISLRRQADALTTLKIILEQGQEPVGILAVLFNHFNKQWLMFQCVSQQMSDKDAARVLKLPYFAVKQYRESASRFSRSQIESALEICTETDRQLKTTSTDPKLAVQFAVQRILSTG